MPADPSKGFQSVLSACMEKFLQEKHACGYAYREQTRILRHLDNFLVQEGLATYEVCARFHIGGSNPIDFRAPYADRRRASKVLSGRGRARAYRTFASAASHHAGSFPAPVWMRVSCQ